MELLVLSGALGALAIAGVIAWLVVRGTKRRV
jgi:hypothetical protein